MRKSILALGIAILPALISAQVKSRVTSHGRTVNQLEAYGRVTYMGINYYPIGGDSLTIKNDVNRSDSVIIPEVLTIDNRPYIVTGLKESAFEYNTHNRYISLPPSITEIASSAFRCTDIREIEMPGVKNIGAYAFFRANFETLVLPDSLKRIDGYAFGECASLRYVELPSGLEYIGGRAFMGCEKLDTVKVNFSTPIELGPSAFIWRRPNSPYRTIILSVPKGSKAAFQEADQWRLFRIIEHD